MRTTARTALAVAAALTVTAAGCRGGGDRSAGPEAGPATGGATTTALGTSTTAAPAAGGTSTTGPGGPGTAATTTAAPGPPTGPPPRLRLTRLAALEAPTALAVRSGDPALYVTEQVGRVVALRGDEPPVTVADISGQVRSGGEQGLLGIAFEPGGRSGYLYFNRPKAGCANGEIVVAEYPFAGGRLDTGAGRELLTIDHCRFSNHNGGQLAFGPDGFLYLAVGDGGGGGDPEGNGQDPRTLLGAVLRIDPARPAGGRQYGIPPGNPFADGRDGAPEVWAYGLRNPWRFSFDRANGDQWISDVGQNAYEEVNLVPAGRAGVNYGWSRREGRHPFRGGSRPPGAVDPVVELSHGDGVCSITGGFVYRGSRIPGLVGRYVFSDFCDARIRAARPDTPLWRPEPTGATGSGVRSFGEDAAGELYVLDNDGIARLDPA